jgi:hypothetical protein
MRNLSETVEMSPSGSARKPLMAGLQRPTGNEVDNQCIQIWQIETALTLRLVSHLPLRQTEGFLGSILRLMGLDHPYPDHTTLSRRNRTVDVCRHLNHLPDGPAFQRDRHIEAIKKAGRFSRKRESGYYLQSHAENAVSRYKRIITGRLRGKRDEAQEREALIACSILNRMREMGRPQSYPVG